MNIHVAVISHARPHSVAKMQELVDVDLTWYVGHGEGKEYMEAGAKHVIESGGLCPSRNRALRDAFRQGKTCVQLSDDLSAVKFILENGAVREAVSFSEVLDYMEKELSKTLYRLAGVAPTPNAFYFHKPFSDDLFIVGDFIMVRPCNLFFDENLMLKEDYDYTLQHFNRYGGALRFNAILATFAHRSNKGGAVEYRTSDREKEAISYLFSKHPGRFRMNPRRPDEILLAKAPRKKAKV